VKVLGVVVVDQKPKLSFKNVEYVEISSSGQSVKILVSDCPRSVFECRPVYASREQLLALLHGHRKDVTLYVLEPEK
jgi:hypothetical protein